MSPKAALTSTQEGFEPLQKWKRFRKDFIAFIDSIDIEQRLFHQMLERFLISADITHEEQSSLMNNPDHTGWHSKGLVDMLKSKLGDAYEAYMNTLRTMCGLMADLQSLLCLSNGKVSTLVLWMSSILTNLLSG